MLHSFIQGHSPLPHLPLPPPPPPPPSKFGRTLSWAGLPLRYSPAGCKRQISNWGSFLKKPLQKMKKRS